MQGLALAGGEGGIPPAAASQVLGLLQMMAAQVNPNPNPNPSSSPSPSPNPNPNPNPNPKPNPNPRHRRRPEATTTTAGLRPSRWRAAAAASRLGATAAAAAALAAGAARARRPPRRAHRGRAAAAAAAAEAASALALPTEVVLCSCLPLVGRSVRWTSTARGRRRRPPSRWRAPVLAAPPRPRLTRPSTAVRERCAPSPTSSSDALRRRDSHLRSRGGLPRLIVYHPDTPHASLIPIPYSYARECVLVCRRYDPC